jgi:uncharacterized protein YcbK (DUF882 family)
MKMLRVVFVSLAFFLAGSVEVQGAQIISSRATARPTWPSASRNHTRGKKTTKRSGKVVGTAVPEKDLRTEPLPKPSGNIHIYSVNYQIEARVNMYNDDGSFRSEALSEIEHVFRCRRSGREHAIDPRLLAILSHVYDHFGGKRLELLSGYRYQRRTTSHHFNGSAADIRIPGVDPRRVRAFVNSLDSGGMGIGYYPRIQFVHVDVRELPSYRWTDYSRTNPDASEKQPPRSKRGSTPQS